MVLMALWFAGGEGAGLAPIDYSDFQKLIEAKKLSRVTFVGTDKIVGEVQDPNSLPTTILNAEEFRSKHLSKNKFTVNKIDHTENDKLLANDYFVRVVPAWIGGPIETAL